MATGLLAWMCLALGQNANDVSYYNYRSHGIPVTYQENRRNETKRVLLYVSTDQGRTWQLGESIPSTKDQFAFHATKDGLYWLSVAMVNQQDKQEPDDKTIMNSPPHLKMVIDTVNPIVRTINAQRQGDEVNVSWDIQEENPARDGVKLEYQVKDAGSSIWLPIPGAFTQNGQAHFRPGNAATLVIRLTVRDLAGNQSFALTEAAGTLAPANFNNAGGGIANGAGNSRLEVPTLPGGGMTVPPVDSPKRPELNGGAIAIEPPTVPTYPQPPAIEGAKPPVQAPTGFGTAPPPGFNPPAAQAYVPPQPPAPAYVQPPAAQAYVPQQAPATRDPITTKLAADSRAGVPVSDPTNDALYGQRTVANSSPARRPLPPLMHVNSHQVTLEYELKRVGPSGVGEVELWLTKDDGASWEQYAKDKDVASASATGRQKRTFDFRDLNTDQPFTDGIYGLTLVVKNRAGVGRQPRPGDTPEIRIEIDKDAPLAQLYEPIADPQRSDHVLIMWNAVDKNLVAAPISLEYAEVRDGPWQPIKLDLDNKGRYPGKDRTGDFSWKVPADIPVQVYLKLRVRDKAGNESVAVTDRPHYVDLIEPEGVLIGVQPATKR